MGRFRLTRRRRALLGYLLGCALLVAGIWTSRGVPAGLIAAGVITAGSFLLFADVEEVKLEEPPAVASIPQRLYDPTL